MPARRKSGKGLSPSTKAKLKLAGELVVTVGAMVVMERIREMFEEPDLYYRRMHSNVIPGRVIDMAASRTELRMVVVSGVNPTHIARAAVAEIRKSRSLRRDRFNFREMLIHMLILGAQLSMREVNIIKKRTGGFMLMSPVKDEQTRENLGKVFGSLLTMQAARPSDDARVALKGVAKGPPPKTIEELYAEWMVSPKYRTPVEHVVTAVASGAPWLDKVDWKRCWIKLLNEDVNNVQSALMLFGKLGQPGRRVTASMLKGFAQAVPIHAREITKAIALAREKNNLQTVYYLMWMLWNARDNISISMLQDFDEFELRREEAKPRDAFSKKLYMLPPVLVREK